MLRFWYLPFLIGFSALAAAIYRRVRAAFERDGADLRSIANATLGAALILAVATLLLMLMPISWKKNRMKKSKKNTGENGPNPPSFP